MLTIHLEERKYVQSHLPSISWVIENADLEEITKISNAFVRQDIGISSLKGSSDWFKKLSIGEVSHHDIYVGDSYWVIYYYLVENKFLRIQNEKAWTTDPDHRTSTQYDSMFEDTIYKPIMDRLIKEGFYQRSEKRPSHITISKSYLRNKTLDGILL